MAAEQNNGRCAADPTEGERPTAASGRLPKLLSGLQGRINYRDQQANKIVQLYSLAMQVDSSQLMSSSKFQLQQMITRKQISKNGWVRQQIQKYIATKKLNQRIIQSLARYKVKLFEEQSQGGVKFQKRGKKAAIKRKEMVPPRVRQLKQRKARADLPELSHSQPQTERSQQQQKAARWFLVGLKGGRCSMRNFDFWLKYRQFNKWKLERDGLDELH